jgi:TolA-binding protein
MSVPGFCLRHLVFLGPQREPATVAFGPGLNIVYGASDTGKSFLVEAIDFMLGGKPPLRDIPERVGYDRILLGIETYAGEAYTIFRSIEGGRFRLYIGLHAEMPPEGTEARDLGEQHSERSADNLSSFLLENSNLAGKRVRKNKRGDTNSLSFRNVARLMIVTETEITDQRSPLSDGNPTADTPNFATFKLMLTGVDDSALVATAPATQEDQTREVQAELLDQLIADYRDRLRELTRSPKELEDQLGRIETSLQRKTEQLGASEADFRRLSGRRRELREKLEQGKDRRAEITSLLERFDLLDQHYHSDLARLRGIEETGTLFVALGQSPCPLCGAEPAHQIRDTDCDGNVDAVVAAAGGEIAKIDVLRSELTDTVATLRREVAAFDRSLPKLEEQLRGVSSEIETMVSPQLARMRASYAELADKRGGVREALAMLRTLQDVEQRRALLDRDAEDQKGNSVSDGDLPTTTAKNFAQQVEAVLKAWHFPEADRVFFDPKARDLVIAGKARIARGKGLRAITHAAFTIGLLEYCRAQETPHPGFVVLDSPLLAYRAPEGTEDDLRGTDLNLQFYAYLAAQGSDRQTIIVENNDPPEAVRARPQVTMFTGNPHSGRYGLFPPDKPATASKEGN